MAVAMFALPSAAQSVCSPSGKCFSFNVYTDNPNAGTQTIHLVFKNLTPDTNSNINSLIGTVPSGITIPSSASQYTATTVDPNTGLPTTTLFPGKAPAIAPNASTGVIKVNGFQGLAAQNASGLHAMSINFTVTVPACVGVSFDPTMQ